ncbi:hypothetical protein N7470_000775 [Penicillium chermesinum]|nr:hypothetical protein N7470_000775 [Penicillium chermesinum]
MPCLDKVSEDGFFEILGKPEIGHVQRADGKDLELGVPEYIFEHPKVIFHNQIDYHVDLWSMGCMLFELFTGQPPFDTFLITPRILVGQMQEMASDDLPKRWQKIWNTMNKGDDVTVESSGPNLQEWLQEVYFDGHRAPDLTREGITRLGEIIGSLLCFEPSARASARQILDDPWFKE